MTEPYYIEQMPVVDQSADTATLAAEALEFVRRSGIRPWAPAQEPVWHYPSWQQHADARTTPDMVFGQYSSEAPAYLAPPEAWRLTEGSYLLAGMSGHGKDCGAWIAAHTRQYDAAVDGGEVSA